MGSHCVLCKKSRNKGSPERSFHIFPKNETKRAEWVKLLGNIVTADSIKNENHTVCSDHFSARWYNPLTKLIISAAVPDVTLDHTSTTTVSAKRRGLSTTPNVTMMPVVHADGTIRTVQVVNHPKQPVMKVINANVVAASKRVSSSGPMVSPAVPGNITAASNNDTTEPNLIKPRYRNRKLNNLSKSDFTSDGAWQIYRASHFETKRRDDVLKKKIARNVRKRHGMKKKLKNFVSDLKSKQEFDVAQYLEVIIS